MDYFKNPESPAEMQKFLLSVSIVHGAKPELQEGEQVLLYQCDGTGLFFPGDYLEMWGRKYGLGLGKDVVSECLESNYRINAAQPSKLKDVTQIMFPLIQGGHGVSPVRLSQADAKKVTPAILAIHDPHMYRRGKLLRQKQLDNKNGLLKQIIYQSR